MGGPQCSPLFGVPSVYAYTLLRRMTKYGKVTRVERAQLRPILRGWSPGAVQVRGFSPTQAYMV